MNCKLCVVAVLIAVVVFVFLLFFVWNFTIDDAYITFRYSKNLAEGNGLVWNIGDAPTEGYSNFLWVLINAFAFFINVSPELLSKVISVFALIVMIFLYWKITGAVFEKRKHSRVVAFFAGVIFLLLNPATATHTAAGLETMLYSATILLLVYIVCSAVSTPNVKKLLSMSFVAIICSLIRPEGMLVSGGLFLLIIVLTLKRRISKTQLIVSLSAYAAPIALYMLFRIYYFGELFPLTFFVKGISHSSIVLGLYSMIGALAYIAPFIATVLLSVVLYPRIKSARWKFDSFTALLIVCGVIVFFANIIYVFSPLWTNYAYRAFYPSFVFIYIIAAISIAFLFEKMKKNVARIGIVLIVLLLLLPNAIFLQDFRMAVRSGDRLHVYTEFGNVLSKFPNLTIANEDAGALPYFSGLHHVDMIGLTDKFIAKNRYATQEYIDKTHPSLIIFIADSISNDGMVPRGNQHEQPFIEYAQKHQYVRLFPIRWQKEYYLVLFLDPNFEQFDDVRIAIQELSEKSFKSWESSSFKNW